MSIFNQNQIALSEIKSKLLTAMNLSVKNDQIYSKFWSKLQDFALKSDEYTKYFKKVPVTTSNCLDVTDAFNFEDDVHPLVFAYTNDFTAGIALVVLSDPFQVLKAVDIDNVEGEIELDSNQYLINQITEKLGAIEYMAGENFVLNESIFKGGIVLHLTVRHYTKPTADNRMVCIASNLIFLARGLRVLNDLFKS